MTILDPAEMRTATEKQAAPSGAGQTEAREKHTATGLARRGSSPKPPASNSFLDRFFQITKRGSTLAREFRGGIVTFFTMAYIVILNPLILGDSPPRTHPRTWPADGCPRRRSGQSPA